MVMNGQQTYQPPQMPGVQWSPNAVPVRFDPTTRQWSVFFNGVWTPRPDWDFNTVNELGRQGQAYQISFAESGGTANTTTQVQGEVPPNLLSRDNAQVAPSGEITARPPEQRVPVPDGAFNRDNAQLAPTGEILALPGQQPARPGATPATPPQAERGNNANATFNPQTNTWNVDPADAWKGTPMASPPAASSRPLSEPLQPGELQPTTTPLSLPVAQAQADLAPLGQTPQAPTPFGRPAEPRTREEEWMQWLLGGRQATPAFSRGGAYRPRYAEGGAQGPMPIPDAIVGEGLETATPQFDTPERGELVLEPMPGMGKDIFRVTHAEGPTGVQADGGMLVIPLSEPADAIARAYLAPAEGMKGAMAGDTFQAGPLALPTAPGSVRAAGAPGGEGATPAMATGGIFPPASLLGLSSEWLGLPGGRPPAFQNLRDFSVTNDSQRERLDQLLRANNYLSGIQGVETELRRSSPGRLSLPSYQG